MRQLSALLRCTPASAAPDLALVTLLGSGKGALDDAELSQLADPVADQGRRDRLACACHGGLLTPGPRKRVGGLLAFWADRPATDRLADQ